MVAYPNPPVRAIDNRDDLADIWETARVVGVKPGTIRVWVTRRKIEPVLPTDGSNPDLFHLPTALMAAQGGAKHRQRAA